MDPQCCRLLDIYKQAAEKGPPTTILVYHQCSRKLLNTTSVYQPIRSLKRGFLNNGFREYEMRISFESYHIFPRIACRIRFENKLIWNVEKIKVSASPSHCISSQNRQNPIANRP